MEPSTEPASTFPLFQKLPAELRIAIWKLTIPSRVVKVRTIPAPCPHPFGRPAFASIDPQPALLSVNRESRKETLKNYVIIHDPYCPRFYFNSQRDTIYFDIVCPSWITILYDMNLRRPTAPSAVRSIALLNDSMSAGLFTTTVLRCGVLEVFLVAKYWAKSEMPNLWSLYPQKIDENMKELDYEDGDMHERIIQKLGEARAADRPPTRHLPMVTAVQSNYWDREGVKLRGAW